MFFSSINWNFTVLWKIGCRGIPLVDSGFMQPPAFWKLCWGIYFLFFPSSYSPRMVPRYGRWRDTCSFSYSHSVLPLEFYTPFAVYSVPLWSNWTQVVHFAGIVWIRICCDNFVFNFTWKWSKKKKDSRFGYETGNPRKTKFWKHHNCWYWRHE